MKVDTVIKVQLNVMWGKVNCVFVCLSVCQSPAGLNFKPIFTKLHQMVDRIIYIFVPNLHKFLTAIDEWKKGPEKCPVSINIPWKGKMSQRYEEQIKRSVSNTYLAVSRRVIFTSRRLIPAVKKDVLPASKLSNIIHEFKC